MNRLAQEAVLVGLARRLHDRGSWGGETHLQKATYLMHELLGVPFDFRFILYKHGPFSFELRDELGSMRADRLLDVLVEPSLRERAKRWIPNTVRASLIKHWPSRPEKRR